MKRKILLVTLLGLLGLILVTKYVYVKPPVTNKIPIHIVLLGTPGAGKGTQAQELSKEYKIPIISVGDMLRETLKKETSISRKIKAIMAQGNLVPDDIVLNLVKKRINEKDCNRGYIFDGFPRNISQAEELNKSKIKLDYVIEISVPDNDIVDRLSGRWIHLKSGRTYHVKSNPPKTPGKDDITGEKLVQREDDKKETILNRLKVYHEKTEPLVKFYQELASDNKTANAPKYIKIDGTGTVEQVKERIFTAINKP